MSSTDRKHRRHEYIQKRIDENPFLKDDELAREFGVSVATIRIDRAELGISQYRERIKNVAEHMSQSPNGGELLDLTLFKDGMAVMTADESMVFDNTDIVKSHYIYAFAEKLALSVIDAEAALVKVANVKYINAVRCGDSMFAYSRIIRAKDGGYIVHVTIKVRMAEVFRGKFSLIYAKA